MEDNKLDKNRYFDLCMLSICQIIASRSTCVKGKVGCVIVKDGRIISTGYNGTLPGFKHCLSINDCPRKNIKSGTQYEIGDCQHAETNSILFASKSGVSMESSTLYVSSSVCRMCARNIISVGIKRVVCISSQYDGNLLLHEANIEVSEYNNDEIIKYGGDIWKELKN